jgi:hypothetical protein
MVTIIGRVDRCQADAAVSEEAILVTEASLHCIVSEWNSAAASGRSDAAVTP